MDEDELIDLLRRFAELPPQIEESQEVAEQLAAMTFAIHGLLQFSSDPVVQVLSACALARLEPSEAILPVLMEGLQSDAESMTVVAIYGCRCLGPLAVPAVPKLIELLASDNDIVVHHAIQALAAIGPASASAVPALVGLLRGLDPDSPAIHVVHAWAAVSALGAIGSHGAIPALRQCLGLDTSDELLSLIKLSAAEAIWRINGDTEIPLRVASEMLGNGESNIRCHAVELLGKLGPAGRPAIAELQRLLEDDEEAVRRHVAEALAKIGEG